MPTLKIYSNSYQCVWNNNQICTRKKVFYDEHRHSTKENCCILTNLAHECTTVVEKHWAHHSKLVRCFPLQHDLKYYMEPSTCPYGTDSILFPFLM